MSAIGQTAHYTKLHELESYLRKQIRGQDHVLSRITSVLRRGELGLRKTGRPRGSFLFSDQQAWEKQRSHSPSRIF